MNIVKVTYTEGGRQYSYFSDEPLAVGDLVKAPLEDGWKRSRVVAVDVPESEITGFRDRMRTIPAGSKVGPVETTEQRGILEQAARAQTEVPVTEVVIEVNPYPKEIIDEASGISVPNEKWAAWNEGHTAIINIAPGRDPGVLALQDQVLGLLSYAQTRAIASDEDVKLATDDLSLMSGLKKAIEAKRKEYVDPINSHLKEINEKFALLSGPLVLADSTTRTKVLAYRAEVDRIRRETEEINRKRLEAAQQEAALHQGEISEEVKVLDVPPPPAAHVRTDVGTLGQTGTWSWELEDTALVPKEYLMVNTVLVGGVVRGSKGKVVIPGIKNVWKPGLRVTAR